MSNHSKTRIARQDTFSFAAGQYLYKHGAMQERELLASLASALRQHDQREALQCAIQAGWLRIVEGDLIDCSPFARAHYDQLAGIVGVKPLGQIAAPREAYNAFERPALSKKNMPNSRGSRIDIPAWSVRPAGFGFKSIGGGGV